MRRYWSGAPSRCGTRRPPRALVAALFAALGIGAGGVAHAADLVVNLAGEGSSSGAPLSATVEITVLAPDEVLLHVSNTSPQASPALMDAPVLTRLGFNLAGGPAAGCISVDSPSWWSVTTRLQPFCGIGAGGKRPGSLFAYQLVADNPKPKWGVFQGETLDLVLSLDLACAGGFTFTAAAFADAPTSPSGGVETQWAAKFQVVGVDGQDSGCAQGVPDEPPPPPPECDPTFTWAEFIAVSADTNGLPSLYADPDTRAGSVELNVNGGFGFDAATGDAPYEAGILTLRNGAIQILEQWHLNRFWADAVGCEPGGPPYKCWISAPLDLIGTVLSAAVPALASSSNDGFDPSGLRVEVGGELHIGYGAGPPVDNSHETLIIGYRAPLGLSTAQLQIRARYDYDLDGLDVGDPMVLLFRRSYPIEPDYHDPSVEILEETDQQLILRINAQAGLLRVCDRYTELGLLQAPATVDGPGGPATVGP